VAGCRQVDATGSTAARRKHVARHLVTGHGHNVWVFGRDDEAGCSKYR
jgi:hypothetical protein